jgi:hypothetical protein
MGPGSLAVSSPSSPGVGIGVGGSPAAEEEATAENLILWTEEQDNAVWSRTLSVIVSVDAAAAPTGPMTADGLSSLLINSTMAAQSSAVAASAGDPVTVNHALTADWVRVSATGTFVGLAYTFSVYLRGGDQGSLVQLALERAGGVLRCRLIDREDGVSAFVWGAQLEQSATATAYQRREGT